MRAGKYNKQVTFKQKVVTQEPVYGTDVVTWEPLVSEGSPPSAQKCWAEVMPVLPSRSEAVRQGLSLARDQVNMRVRWRSDVTADLRVIIHDVTDLEYEIVAGPVEVVDEGRRRVLEMTLEKFSTSGTVV